MISIKKKRDDLRRLVGLSETSTVLKEMEEKPAIKACRGIAYVSSSGAVKGTGGTPGETKVPDDATADKNVITGKSGGGQSGGTTDEFVSPDGGVSYWTDSSGNRITCAAGEVYSERLGFCVSSTTPDALFVDPSGMPALGEGDVLPSVLEDMYDCATGLPVRYDRSIDDLAVPDDYLPINGKLISSGSFFVSAGTGTPQVVTVSGADEIILTRGYGSWGTDDGATEPFLYPFALRKSGSGFYIDDALDGNPVINYSNNTGGYTIFYDAIDTSQEGNDYLVNPTGGYIQAPATQDVTLFKNADGQYVTSNLDGAAADSNFTNASSQLKLCDGLNNELTISPSKYGGDVYAWKEDASGRQLFIATDENGKIVGASDGAGVDYMKGL